MKGTVKVLICDGTPNANGATFRAEGIELPEGEVPAILEFREGDLPSYVGRAKLRMETGVLLADLVLLPRMADNSALYTLYPIPTFTVYERKDNIIHTARLGYLALSITQHSDHRILTLGHQGFKP